MSDVEKNKNDIWPVIFILLIVPATFFYGGLWIGIIVLVIGVIALGWKKRHEGYLPTDKSKN